MYGFGKVVSGEFDVIIDKVTAALKEQGFGVLTDIDVQATLKAKLDLDRKAYRILGACNPKLASQAIDAEAEIGLLLPCNVLVREQEDGTVHVSFMDPEAVLGLVDNPQVSELGGQVKGMMQNVMNAL